MSELIQLRIALCTAHIPFIRRETEPQYDHLHAELCKRNHEVEYIKIPFKDYPPQRIISHSLIWKLLDLSDSGGSKIDGVIAQNFPSYLIKHDSKVVWLPNQYRAAYDLTHSQFDEPVSYGAFEEIVRRKIQKIDETALKETQKIYTISQTVANRLLKFNHLYGEVLYMPPPHVGKYRCSTYDNYIFCPNQLDLMKRQDLIIKAMRYVHSDLRLILLGSGPAQKHYIAIAHDYGVDDRVDFLGNVSDEQLLELYSNAFCVACTPFDEELGYVVMEAFLSKKPVITCSDSGGTLELIEDSQNGYIASPSPEDIAKRINTLHESNCARTMGEKGYLTMKDINLSWDHVIDKLLEPMQ